MPAITSSSQLDCWARLVPNRSRYLSTHYGQTPGLGARTTALQALREDNSPLKQYDHIIYDPAPGTLAALTITMTII